MALTTLLTKLNGPKAKATMFLRDQGECVGSGCQRTAYKVGPYVVKANTGAWATKRQGRFGSDPKIYERGRHVPAKALRDGGVTPPRVWYAGARRQWVVMPYYSRKNASDVFYQKFRSGSHQPRWQVAPGVIVYLDLHTENVGLRPDGALVAFDW